MSKDIVEWNKWNRKGEGILEQNEGITVIIRGIVPDFPVMKNLLKY